MTRHPARGVPARGLAAAGVLALAVLPALAALPAVGPPAAGAHPVGRAPSVSSAPATPSVPSLPSPVPGRRSAPVPTPTVLRIETVPVVAGARFVLDGTPIVTGVDGVAEVRMSRADRAALAADRDAHLRVGTPTVALPGGARARFTGWFGAGEYQYATGERMRATFSVERLVSFRFSDPGGRAVDAARVTGVELLGSTGARVALRGAGPVWLPSTRVARGQAGPVVRKLSYAVHEVAIRGSNVVHRDQQRFEPEATSRVPIDLLLFDAEFSTHDAFLGRSVPARLRLRFPDRSWRQYELGADGSVSLRSLPRGRYTAVVVGAGPRMRQYVELSRDQQVALRTLTWLDVGIVGGFLALGLGGLLLAGRHLRRRGRRRERARLAVPGGLVDT